MLPFAMPTGASFQVPALVSRPADLAQDDTPMLAVVQHALAQIPGPPEQIICLLQPTAVFRTPEHVRKAIALLRETQADSVVSVVELPKTHHPRYTISWPPDEDDEPLGYRLRDMPPCRQDVKPVYIRDGTVYAFWRKTVTQHGTIYGQDCRPLILDPSESCELDTEADWAAVQARWEREHAR